MLKFVYKRLNSCIETVYSSLLLRMARMEMGYTLEDFTSNFQSSRTRLKGKSKYTMEYSSCKNID